MSQLLCSLVSASHLMLLFCRRTLVFRLSLSLSVRVSLQSDSHTPPLECGYTEHREKQKNNTHTHHSQTSALTGPIDRRGTAERKTRRTPGRNGPDLRQSPKRRFSFSQNLFTVRSGRAACMCPSHVTEARARALFL